MMNWQLQQAKSRFSEVVQRAQREGPQVVTVRGARAAVLLSAADYDRLTASEPDFVQALLAGPAWPDDMRRTVEERAPEPPRPVEL